MHVMVDGYNVMRAQSKGKFKSSLQEERNRFIEELVQYRMGTSHEVTVVFDGSKNGERFSSATNIRGVRVMFSAQDETADDVIVMLVRQSSRPRDLLVVSSDREIQRSARVHGATVCGASGLLDKLGVSPKFQEHPMTHEEYVERVLKGVQDQEEASSAVRKGPSRTPKKNRARNRLWN